MTEGEEGCGEVVEGLLEGMDDLFEGVGEGDLFEGLDGDLVEGVV